MSDPQDNRESGISDPMAPLYQHVAEAQRKWYAAQNTIASLKGAQEIITAQNHELRDENINLRSQIAKAGQSNSINEGDAQK
ncbi:hypothetical protein FSARC_11221 [Fusarium sarcochroum]|uniref:Uncharacterized protein n=1 Tax=Fusarium sarcochroum TaxID=1208366 RepID=A0A8H4X1C9_9HYPO|nr:hypothetical protein FSARC_11221 [Fusarium sarcochroum]